QCEQVYREKVSGVKADRPQLEELIRYAREGDTVVVWRLDRLGRSLKELIAIVTGFQERGVNFMSLTENIDTSTPTRRLIFNIFGFISNVLSVLYRYRVIDWIYAA